MVTVYDRTGQPYEVADEELSAILASGAYFTSQNVASKGVTMKSEGKARVTVYEIATGNALVRRPVDAAELVRSGKYQYDAPQPKKAVSQPESAPVQQVSSTGTEQIPALPQLSVENSKEDIVLTLSKFGVQHRASMSKADLLNLWNEYLEQQALA